MSILCTHLLACPVCNAALARGDQTLKCANRHSFDIAREGYINLLRKKLPGDSREMLQARRDFFEHNHYHPLSAMLNELVSSHIHNISSPITILDAGCGEGYYLGRLQQYLMQQQHIVEQLAPHFDLIATVPLAYEIHLTRPEIVLAVKMTPNYWHLSEETKRKMAEMTEMRTQVEFSCLLLQKKSN